MYTKSNKVVLEIMYHEANIINSENKEYGKAVGERCYHYFFICVYNLFQFPACIYVLNKYKMSWFLRCIQIIRGNKQQTQLGLKKYFRATSNFSILRKC